MSEEPREPIGIEAPEADVVEQRQEVAEVEPVSEPTGRLAAGLTDAVDPADAVEQSQPVDVADEEYR